MLLYILLPLLIGAPPDPASAAPAATQPLRLAAPAFGQTAEIEIRGLARDASREAIQAAFAEVAEIERLTDPNAPPEAIAGSITPGSIAALNAQAGMGPSPVEPRLMAALVRGLEVCLWSERVHGPLGRDLYRLWAPRTPSAASPEVPEENWEALQRAVSAASCDKLRIDTVAGTATLAAGSAVDLWGFAEGLAVDRAAEILRQRGVTNGFVQIAGVYRGFGPGFDGRGWRIQLPRLPGMAAPMGRVFLRDQSLAVAAAADRPLRVATGDAFPPYVNQRTGRPAQGTLATAVVTARALDAQGLAVTLAIAGPGEGQLRLGALSPRPSVLWLQGNGSGEPLAIEYLWGLVPKR